LTMNKQDLTRAFGRHGEFLTITEIAGIMNIDRGTVRGLLNGVSYIPLGRKKLYHISDIAEVIWSRRI